MCLNVCMQVWHIYIYTSTYIIHVYNLQLHPLAPRLKDSTLPEHAPALSKKLWGVLGIVRLSQNASKPKNFDNAIGSVGHWTLNTTRVNLNLSRFDANNFFLLSFNKRIEKMSRNSISGHQCQIKVFSYPALPHEKTKLHIRELIGIQKEHASGPSGTISRRTHLILKNTSTFVKTVLFWGHSPSVRYL